MNVISRITIKQSDSDSDSGEFKIDFQIGGRGSHLGFPFGRIVTIFNLQVAPILPTKFRVN